MNYTISENRLVKLVEKLVHQVFPKFNKEDTEVMTWSNGDETYLEYFDKIKGGRPFAKYYPWKSELILHEDIFFTLQDYLGDDLMTAVIDWFNIEFEQEAESINY